MSKTIVTPSGLKLGDYAKDLVTDYEGTIIALYQSTTGFWQVCLKAPVTDNAKPNDGEWFEEPQIKKTDATPRLSSPTFDTQDFQIGDGVKDRITKKTGIVHSIVYWLHGCIRYDVKYTEPDRDGKPVHQSYFAREIEAHNVETRIAPLKKSTGGPMSFKPTSR